MLLSVTFSISTIAFIGAAAWALWRSGLRQILLSIVLAYLGCDAALCIIGGALSLAGIPVGLVSMMASNFLMAGALLIAARKPLNQAAHLSQAAPASEALPEKSMPGSLEVATGRAKAGRVDCYDAVFVLGMLAAVVAICLYRFGTGFPVSFATIDFAAHLAAAEAIRDTGSVITGFPNLFFTSFPNSLIIDVFAPFIDQSEHFACVIGKEAINLLASSTLFYSLLRLISGSPFAKKMAVLFGFAYALGYPLNNFLFGFCYLGQAVSLVVAIVAVLKLYRDREVNSKALFVLLLLLLTGLGLSYTLFVPPVFLGTFLYLLVALRRPAAAFAVNVVPVIYTVLFTVVVGASSAAIGPALQNDGFILRNLYMDFVPFTPMAVFLVVMCIKMRDGRYSFLAYISVPFLLFQAVLLAVMLAGLISPYYYYKLNYVLWFIVLAASAACFVDFEARYQVRAFLYTWLATCLVFLLVSAAVMQLTFDDDSFDRGGPGGSYMVYRYNLVYIAYPEVYVAYPQDFVDLCEAAAMQKTAEGVGINEVQTLSEDFYTIHMVNALVGERLALDDPQDILRELPGLPGDGRILVVVYEDCEGLDYRAATAGMKVILSNDYGFVAMAESA
jgi:hypothetical protein